MAKKFNQELLNEELKRFRLLSEFTFMEEPKRDNFILGNELEEADELPTDSPVDVPVDAPVDDSKTNANQSGDTQTDIAAPAPAEDEVDVDVTQLVKGSEDAKLAADDASQKTSELLSKFSDLEQRVAAMDSIGKKIENLEKEIVKRNPTPIEKLEMRALDSFPYSVKLNDYFKDIDGYEATEKNKEYILRQDDIDSGFTDASVKQSFNLPDNYEDDYEEEDITD